MLPKRPAIGRAVATASLLLVGASVVHVAAPVWFDSIQRISSLTPDVVYDSPAPAFLDETSLIAAFREAETGRILAASSPDSGATWTAPWPVLEDGPTGFDDFSLQILRLATGRLILSVRSASSTNTILYSDDRAANFTPGTSRNADGAEKFVVVQGELWHVFSDHVTGDIVYETSPDGVSWSDPTSLIGNEAPATSRLSPIDVARLGNGDRVLLVVRRELEPCCSSSLVLYRSTDTEDWSGPETVLAALDSLDFAPSQIEPTDDSVYVLATNEPATSKSAAAGRPRDIYYLSAGGDATRWSGPQPFTRFPGDDYDPVGTPVGSSLIVFFASDRFSASGSPQIWYGRPGETPDENPPPAILENSETLRPVWSKPGVEVGVAFAAADAEGVTNAEVVTTQGGTTLTWPLFDDGEHGDGAAGDGLWGGTMGPFEFGPDINYFPRAYDASGQTGEGPLTLLEILPFHDVGRLQLVLSLNASFGDFFIPQSPPSGAGQWPGGQGQNYLAGGGIWIGADVDSVDRVMHAFYDPTSGDGDWQPINGVFPESAADISDQDLTVTYSDSAAPHPLGLQVTQTSRQWGESGADNFIIFEYEIANISGDSVRNASAAFWLDPDLVLENSLFALDDLVDWDADRDMVYAHDSGIACNDPVLNPENVLCPPGFIGLRLLSNPRPGYAATNPFTVAVWNRDTDPSRTINDSDESFLELMTGDFDLAHFDSTGTTPDDYRFLSAVQPFSLAPGASVQVAFGIAIGSSLADLQEQADEMAMRFAGTPLSIGDPRRGGAPQALASSAYPNPFSGRTTIQFDLTRPGPVKISVFNAIGSRVAVLLDARLGPGTHRIAWNASTVPSGVYLYRVDTESASRSGKLVKVR